MGNFNFSDINWVDMDAVGKEGKEFVKLINDCFLIQHVHSPTRGKNILDLVMTTEQRMVENIKIHSPISNSDHNLLSLRREGRMYTRTVYSYMRGDYIKISKFPKEVNWEKTIFKTVEESSLFLRTKLEESRNKYVAYQCENYQKENAPHG